MPQMRSTLFSFLFIFMTTGFNIQAQGITGLWEVTKVSMEGKSMTPVAKWTNINMDGTYQSGNGWLQNSTGTWTYNNSSNEFLPEETNGIKDEYGPFSVSFENGNMLWKRMEEGSEVTVTFSKISEKPMSTADKIHGLWDLQTAEGGDKNITTEFDPESKYYIFIRWDRIYMKRTPKGEQVTGYWHINAHRPEITLMSHNGNKEPESWTVDVSDRLLIMTGISDSNNTMKLTFSRLHQFPE